MLSSIGDKCFSGSFTLSHDITYCSNLLVPLTAVCRCQSRSAIMVYEPMGRCYKHNICVSNKQHSSMVFASVSASRFLLFLLSEREYNVEGEIYPFSLKWLSVKALSRQRRGRLGRPTAHDSRILTNTSPCCTV